MLIVENAIRIGHISIYIFFIYFQIWTEKFVLLTPVMCNTIILKIHIYILNLKKNNQLTFAASWMQYQGEKS